MTSPLLHPPAHISPSIALQLSQQAPLLLKTSLSASSKGPLSILSTTETSDTWTLYEHLLLSCLRTRDDESAKVCLERLKERFGESNERVMGLQGMYDEAIAEDDVALNTTLKRYEVILKEDPTNNPIAKRKVALLRSLSRPIDAIAALVKLLEASPTDPEAWSELSELYLSQGLFAQAMFSLEEVLLMAPNAWNIHARMGELIYMSTLSSDSSHESGPDRRLVDSMRWFCRSIELCDDFLRGYYGLKLVTSRLLSGAGEFKITSHPDGLQPPSQVEVQKLNQLATAKLSEIIRRNSSGDKSWQGYDEGEVIAARELLDRDTQTIQR
ncbi:MAG: hypothetical protein M1825_004747 [Sarcosagium campestre]|nr:MAG: hypothetical protein M1825_004747 [Sarcosagium campestre]